jgi:hypothetical protein
MALRIAFTALGIGALMAGFWEAAIVAGIAVVADLMYLQPEVDAAEAAVEAAGVDGETGRAWSAIFTVIMCLVIVGVLFFGAEELMMRGG